MKNLLTISLILSTGIFLSACENGAKKEQQNSEIIQKQASVKLEKIIEEKQNSKVESDEKIPEEIIPNENPVVTDKIPPTENITELNETKEELAQEAREMKEEMKREMAEMEKEMAEMEKTIEREMNMEMEKKLEL